MAENIKISEMPNLAAFDGSEMIPLVHNGGNYNAKFTDMKKFMGGSGSGGSSSEVTISGMINLTDLTAVKAIQSTIGVNVAKFFVIADSSGKIPSKQKCYDVPSDVARQLSMTTGNALVDAVLKSVTVDPFGVCVGDLIAITKVEVAIADLASMFGLSFSVSGKVGIYQYKILHTNGAREEGFVSDDGSTCAKGVYGLLSPWNKQLIEGSGKPTRWSWGYNLDECLQSGVLAYTSALIGGTSANWTIFVDCAATPDNGGYFHLLQTAVGRDQVNLGHMYSRFGYYRSGESPTFLSWMKLT